MGGLADITGELHDEADELSPLEARRARLRALHDKILDAIELIPAPDTFLEGERASRCVAAADRCVTGLYSEPKSAKPGASTHPWPKDHEDDDDPETTHAPQYRDSAQEDFYNTRPMRYAFPNGKPPKDDLEAWYKGLERRLRFHAGWVTADEEQAALASWHAPQKTDPAKPASALNETLDELAPKQKTEPEPEPEDTLLDKVQDITPIRSASIFAGAEYQKPCTCGISGHATDSGCESVHCYQFRKKLHEIRAQAP